MKTLLEGHQHPQVWFAPLKQDPVTLNELDGRERLNTIALLEKEDTVVFFKVGGVVKGGSEREGGKKEGQGLTELGSGVNLSIEK